ncbi:MAG TPA: N(4)-(beta-N-acetylglucosaminyl)-L-asparaginase [Cyclobacteriaceae bacterium]|nr:N(4)-(beta-N-acetylglucosaminyl)-L-asparaginase [Cyclobacteriaceae bacterium]
MIKRRDFIKGTTITALSAGMGLNLSSNLEKSFPGSIFPGGNESGSPGIPVAVATWPNLRATEEAMNLLLRGDSALNAVEAGARMPEADPGDTSVGFGGLPDRDGIVTLDACIMDDKGNAGSVAFLAEIMHPVSVARKVMELTPHVMLSGDGALRFALEQGFKKTNLLTSSSKAAWETWKKTSGYKPDGNAIQHDTIGILALDKSGNLSGACSTSGLAFKIHGRVGDSPIIGAGLYVDNETGAACATGIGELVMKTLCSFLIVEKMKEGATPLEACQTAISRIVDRYGVSDSNTQVGVLAMNKKGEIGAFSIRKGYSISQNVNGDNKIVPSKYAIPRE